ncbi:MAG: redoxin family protein [Vicinamibacterales bacterium]
MDQPDTKIRLAAMAATFVALLVISVPFIWQRGIEAEPAAAVSEATVLEPVASHSDAAGDPAQASGAACMADAKPANLDFTFPDLEGKQVTLSDFKGKVILLNFWATWCGPCKAEIPGFVELQTKHKNDLVVIGLSVDDPADKAKAFATEYKINYPVVLGLGREEVQEAYGPIWGIPASFLISRDAKVCKRHLGIAPKAVFDKEITALL